MMMHMRVILTVAAVIVVAAATLWLAFAVGGTTQPVWSAALGPLLLIAALVAHFRSRSRRAARNERPDDEA